MYLIPMFAVLALRALMLISSIVEIILSVRWIPFFFRIGIPLYQQELRLPYNIGSLESYIGVLKEQLPNEGSRPGVTFKALNSYELAFLQKFQELRHVSLGSAYGLLAYDAQRQLLMFKGYASGAVFIFPVCFLLLFVGGSLFQSALFILFILLIVGVGVMRQYKNYGRIAAAIQQTFQ